MFAVYEEIEHLKERIRALKDRNARLEYENTFLRERASQEPRAFLSIGNPKTSAA